MKIIHQIYQFSSHENSIIIKSKMPQLINNISFIKISDFINSSNESADNKWENDKEVVYPDGNFSPMLPSNSLSSDKYLKCVETETTEHSSTFPD